MGKERELYFKIANGVFDKVKVLSFESKRPISILKTEYPQVHVAGLMVIANLRSKLRKLVDMKLFIGGAKLNKEYCDRIHSVEFPIKNIQNWFCKTNPWLIHQFCMFVYFYTRFLALICEDEKVRASAIVYDWDKEDDGKNKLDNYMFRYNSMSLAQVTWTCFYQMLEDNLQIVPIKKKNMQLKSRYILCPDKTCGLYNEVGAGRLLCVTKFCPKFDDMRLYSRCHLCREVYELSKNSSPFARVSHVCPGGGSPVIIGVELEKFTEIVYKIK